jgi:cephalosporin-C deacetylase
MVESQDREPLMAAWSFRIAQMLRYALVVSGLVLGGIGGTAAPLDAQSLENSVAVLVSPDRADGQYSVGDTVHFRITTYRNGKPVVPSLAWVDIEQERMPIMRRDTIDLSRGTGVVSGTLAMPGFLRATVTAVIDGVPYTTLATAAFDPLKLASPTPMPSDFRAFWTQALDGARRIPLDAQWVRVPKQSTRNVEVYQVSFQNDREGTRIYGILSVPRKPGRYPVLLEVPGAGVRPYYSDTRLVEQGAIHLAIGIHGIPVVGDSAMYDALSATALSSYWSIGMESRETYYFRRVYTGVLRACDFLRSLPQWDGTRFVVTGGSQGGGLAIVAAALEPRITAVAVSYPAMADLFGSFVGRASGFPQPLADTVFLRALKEKKETLAYYDVVNFARILTVPGMYTWGFNDIVVPPTASYATFNAITAAKEMMVYPTVGHGSTPEQERRMQDWIYSRLGLTPPVTR